MVRNSQTQCVIAAVLFAIVLSGCQSSNNKWATAWKERTKPKPKFQGIEGEEEVTYWPYKADKSRKKQTPMPDEIREKLVRKNEQKKRDSQLTELLSKGDQSRVGGQIEDARIAYSQALQIEPDNPSIHHRLAIIADKQRQFRVADEHYQAALKVRPRDVNLLSDLGYSLSLRGNYEQAEATLKKALEIDHSHQGAMANLGDIYAKQNRRDEALAMFRAGSNEGAAQSYMANLFPDDRFGNAPASDADWGNTHSNPAMASNDAPLDYKNMSLDEIRTEMARRGQDAKQRRQRSDQAQLARTREFSAGEELARQERSQIENQYAAPNRNQFEAQQANAVHIDEDWGGPADNSMANNLQRQSARSNVETNARSQQPIEIVRGTGGRGNTVQLPQGLQPDTGGQFASQRNDQNGYQQQNAAYGNNQPPINGQDANTNLNASQYAAQLAMSVGPGSMFPVVPSAMDGETPSGDSSGYNQRFGGEFQQTPAYQNSQNWGSNSIEQTSVSDNAPIEGAPSIAPASPTANWGAPNSRRLNWQNDGATTADWANDSPNSGAAGTGLDSGAGRLNRSQSTDGRRVALNQMDSDWQSQGQTNSNGDNSRPYSGAWPNSNSLPARQTQKAATNGRAFDINNANLQPGLDGNSGNAPAANGNGNANSLPMWKYAPNR